MLTVARLIAFARSRRNGSALVFAIETPDGIRELNPDAALDAFRSAIQSGTPCALLIDGDCARRANGSPRTTSKLALGKLQKHLGA